MRKILASSDVHEFRAEIRRHISEITVCAKDQMRIEGTLAGALDAVLSLVAGARWRAEYAVPARWTKTFRLSAQDFQASMLLKSRS